MSTLEKLWIGLGIAVAIVWWTRLLALPLVFRSRRVLGADTAAAALEHPPKVSVVVAAKDEEDNLEACVRTLLDQQYPDFEVVVVDDRSRDRTPAILTGLVERYGPRLRALTVTELPEDWFGKCHAMHQGVQAADGAWLLFTDADCRLESKNTLSLAMAAAREFGAEFLTIIPSLDAPTVWERVLQPICSLVLIWWFQPGRVNNPARPTAYANGAFMLMTRACYDAVGGHAATRCALNEDIRLARLAKRAGRKLWVVEIDGLLRTRMYGSFRQAWRGWSRIFCGALEHPARIAAAAALVLFLGLVPWISVPVALLGGFPSGSWPGIVWCLALVGEHLTLWRVFGTMGSQRGWSLAYPLAALGVLGMLGNAFLKSTGATQTTWRDTTYRGAKLAEPVAVS